jgi:hypothetical protein
MPATNQRKLPLFRSGAAVRSSLAGARCDAPARTICVGPAVPAASVVGQATGSDNLGAEHDHPFP